MVKRWFWAVLLLILSLDSNVGRSGGVVEVGVVEKDGLSLSRLIRSKVILPCFWRCETTKVEISLICVGDSVDDDTLGSMLSSFKVCWKFSVVMVSGVWNVVEFLLVMGRSVGRLVMLSWILPWLMVDREVVVGGCHFWRNLVLSLTAEIDPTERLSKCMIVDERHNYPDMVQSEESLTVRKKFGKVRKLPVLSAKKLQPISLLKHLMERSGLRSFGTWRTSWSVMFLSWRVKIIVPEPRQGVLLLAKMT